MKDGWGGASARPISRSEIAFYRDGRPLVDIVHQHGALVVVEIDRHIEALVGEIEAHLQKMGRSEVSSRVVGDRVMQGLKELDLIAYVRYAIVYLHLDDLRAIREEVDQLLEN